MDASEGLTYISQDFVFSCTSTNSSCLFLCSRLFQLAVRFFTCIYIYLQFTVSILFKHFRLRNFKVQLQYAVANSKYLAYTLASFNVLIYCSFTNAFYSFHTISLSLAMFQYYLSMYIFSRPLPSFKYRDGWMATPK